MPWLSQKLLRAHGRDNRPTRMNRLDGRLLGRHLFEVQRKIAFLVILEDSYSTEAVAGIDQAFAVIWYLDLETRVIFSAFAAAYPAALGAIKRIPQKSSKIISPLSDEFDISLKKLNILRLHGLPFIIHDWHPILALLSIAQDILKSVEP